MRLYRLLLRLYPASFRDEYGEELCRIFARRRRDAAGPLAVLSLWIGTVADTASSAAQVHLDVLRQDLRYTTRTLLRTPGFTLTAIVVTALGVGATTAAFTLADHVLFRPLPFPDPDRLVKILEGSVSRPANLRGIRGTNNVAPANLLSWREMSSSFAAMGAYGFVTSNLVGSGEPERLDGVSITYEALDITGVRPALGSPITMADDQPGAPCSVLISDGFWRRRFGGSASIVGRALTLDDESCVVAGVMPKGFVFPTRTTVFWRPMRLPREIQDRRNHWLWVIARLKPGVSRQQADADLTAVSATLGQKYPEDNGEVRAVMMGLREELGEQPRMLLFALLGASACVLLIACTNLASLLIARATARGRELAVRTAMGAGRERLVRQLLTESVLLALCGGGLGLVVATAAVPMAVKLVPTALPIAEVPAMDLRMLMIAAFVTLGTGIGFGVWPAFRTARQAGGVGLRDGARAGAGRGSQRVRAGLVVAQVGMSIVLLVGAGLLIRALIRVQSTPPGFNADGVLTMRTTLPWTKYALQAPRVEFVRRVIEGVSALPGVTGVAYTSYLPMTMRGGIWPVELPGRPPAPGSRDTASARYITPEYFRVMQIPLTLGRGFQESDTLNAQPVAIVSERFVQAYLDGQPPIGRTFQFGPAGERTIVGVVGEVRVRGLESRSEPQVYLAYQQQRDNSTLGYIPKDLVVRLDAERSGEKQMAMLTAPIRRIVASVDPNQPIADIQPLAAIVDGETAPRSVQVRVLGAFAALACLLAAVGLHGLLSFVVAARSREFGIRLALGAEPREILTLVARRGLVLGMAGVAAGVVVAYLVGRWMESLLVGVSPADAPALAIAISVSVGMTLAGSLLPAMRAARTSPAEAMKTE
jgi:putative ABC transport system permease protein